ncbi:DUF2339 domain-containing protein [Serratia sp. DD3]|uniref:DUF2339 domain-containing protein n=1 Tax=Serratia sp. DD3 TaxID=1410619 RepID=UPI0003C4F4AE|nr:DUF2339 domain-containing protein [Serratia sp. DD3]KEY57307.1 putative membrane protein [Serratia sp. DD3]
MEYWLWTGLLIFMFIIYKQISALSESVKYIREELTKLSSQRPQTLSTPEVAPDIAAQEEHQSTSAVEEEQNVVTLPDFPATASDPWSSTRPNHWDFVQLKKQEQIEAIAAAYAAKEQSEQSAQTTQAAEETTSSEVTASSEVLQPLDQPQTISQTVNEEPAHIQPTVPVPDVWVKLDKVLFSLDAKESIWKRLEQEFAARWMVWIGGVIMALGVIFLLKAGSERGLFGPTLRISVATVLSLLMVAGGELLRRSRFQLPLANARYIPAALSGAGIIGLFASMLAAKYLYDMFPMPVLMLLLSLTSLLAMVLALWQGPFMAALGLLGAYTVPLFVSTGSGNVTGLLAYVFLVSLAAIGLMSRVYRRWLWLGAMAGNYLWLLISLTMATEEHQLARSLFLLATTYGFLAWPHLGWSLKSKMRFRNNDWTNWPNALLDPLFTGFIAAFSLFALTVVENYSLLAWATLILFSISLLLIAKRSPSLDLFVPVVGVLAISPFINPVALFTPERVWVSLVGVSLLALICGIYGIYQVTRPVYRKLWWAALSVLVPMCTVASTYYACRDNFEPFWVEYSLLAVCLVMYVAWNMFSDLYARASELLRSIYQIAAQLMLAFALFICFSQVTLTLLLAAQLLLLVLWQRWRQISLLPWIFKIHAMLLLARLSLNPFIIDYSSPLHIASVTIPWTLYGFGIPILCLWLSSRLLATRRGDDTANWLAANAIYLLALWINVELRHLLHGSYHLSLDFASLTDCALHGVTFGIMALAYGYRERLADSLRDIYRWAAQASAVLMLLMTAASLLAFNPLWSAQSVGSLPLLNMVTVAYAIPMLFMLVALKFWPDQWLTVQLKPYVLGVTALLGMVFITLTVRQLWHGARLDSPVVYSGEQYSYSLVWMLTAIGMMYGAIHWSNDKIRLASLGLLALTIVKLFLWDMSGLEGLYRSASFLGLGLCLVAVGWFYQKFVTMKIAEAPTTEDTESTAGQN